VPGDSSPFVVINTAATRGEEEIHSRGGGGTSPQGPIPLLKNHPKKENIQKPTGEFESVNTPSSDSGRDIDGVKGAGGVAKAGERRNQIPFCVDESDITTSPLTISRGGKFTKKKAVDVGVECVDSLARGFFLPDYRVCLRSGAGL